MLGFNMFAYCNNNPVNLKDHSGTIPFADDPFSEAYQQVGAWLSPYAATFFSKVFKSLSGSWSISGEVGSGLGLKGKIGAVSAEACAIIVADEWTLNSDGTTEAIRKGSIAIQGELVDKISLGADVQYYVPLEDGKKYGLLAAPGGKFDLVIGAYVFGQGIGWNTMSLQDIEFSLGFSGYFILGGGVEFSINLYKFAEIWCTQ